MIEYVPRERFTPSPLLDVPTAWKEVAPVIKDILDRFEVGRGIALEFGVDYGYSTSVLSHFFDEVGGVDTFKGDVHAGDRGEGIYQQVVESMKAYPNVTLAPADYRNFIKGVRGSYDLIHIDIVHTYAETYECGEWAIQHAPVVIFHDTLSFPDVMKAVTDLAESHGLNFYNVNEQHGLGILTKRTPR